MDALPPPIEPHEAVDRFGKAALRTAHDLAVAGAVDGEPVVLSRRGPHRTIDGLAALLDAALDDDAHTDRRESGEPACPAEEGAGHSG